MQNLKIELENCYGISCLRHEFNFTPSRSYSVYAPNGFMKTSLAKTFADLSKGRPSSDQIFPERQVKRIIKDENSADLDPDSIFVIEPYNKDFSSEKSSLLLVNQDIKSSYDSALEQIDEKKNSIIKRLKQLSGLTGRSITPETEILSCFGETSIFDALENISNSAISNPQTKFSDIIYCEIFNDKTLALLRTGQIKTQIQEYIDQYNDLISKSGVLNKSFNHHNASSIQKGLSESGFFSANHTLNISNGSTKEEVFTSDRLSEVIEDEKKRILSNEALLSKFDAIDKKLSNAELRKFRDYLFDNREIVPELSDFEGLRRSLWINYLSINIDLIKDFISVYSAAKLIIKDSIEAAKNEQTAWEEVVEQFKGRFSVPFQVSVSNQEEVILKGIAPTLSFTFEDHRGSKQVDRDSLLKVLSQGERRALYILNIIFEINARTKSGTKTLLIVDDIADSFDYKNKYAIVEYLKDVSDNSNFCSIFLTHNFDFYRTISGRLNIPRSCRLHASRSSSELKLLQEKYQQKVPFEVWKTNLHDHTCIIASIPFVRNLAQYCGYYPEYLKLTSLLHYKDDTSSIAVRDLEAIFKIILKDIQNVALPEPAKSVAELTFETAEIILAEPSETAELESKIVLSIAIRLAAERLMVHRIADPEFVKSITSNQTIHLISKFKSLFPSEKPLLQLLEQVNLMTPENIHLNSFMYEPILDMSAGHLKQLFIDLTAIPIPAPSLTTSILPT